MVDQEGETAGAIKCILELRSVGKERSTTTGQKVKEVNEVKAKLAAENDGGNRQQ